MTASSPKVEERSGLECRAGGLRLVIPSEAVSRVIDYIVAPLPLSHRGLAVGLTEPKGLFLSISASPKPQQTRERKAKGVVLLGTQTALECVLEVEEVTSLVRVDVSSEPIPPGSRPWLKRASLPDRTPVVWLDVGELSSALKAKSD